MPGSLSVASLRCEYLINPVGLHEAHPRLSWILAPAAGHEKDRGLSQSAYQIMVASTPAALEAGKADLWDSGKIASAQTVLIPYAGKLLASAQRAYWTVRVWDQGDQPSPPATPAFWETGLLTRTEWSAQWIGSSLAGSPQTEVPAPFLRKSFNLPAGKAIASARLYATALGFHEFHLNGQKVSEDVFSPGWTDYRKRVQYQAYDVTGLLKPGAENVAGAILGDGWYAGYIGNTGRRQFYGDRPRLLAQLVVRFADGSSQTVATDGTWSVAFGPILASDMLMGESYNAQLELPGWDAPGYKQIPSTWSPVVTFPDPGIALTPMSGPPVRAVEELKPLKITKRADRGPGTADYLVDLGQNMVGRVRLKLKGPTGHTVTLKFAEVLDKDGNLYTTNLRAARQTDHYTLKGDPAGETFEPRFTFHGFRYVQINQYPGELTPDAVTGVVLHSDMPQTGTFECSDPLVNQLQHNIQWGQRGNFIDVPTDCPQRDERLGWTGDAQVFIRTAAFNFDVSGFFAKWTQDLRDAQGGPGGYPSVVPNTESGADGGPAWADAGVICPWTMFLCYGDARLVERHYDSMAKFVEYLRQGAEPFGLIRSHPEWKGWHGFGDWLSQDGKDGLFGNTPKDLIGTAFLAYDAQLLAAIARALGKEPDAARYDQLARQTAAAFNRRYVTPDGLIIGNSQTSYVLALHFNLLPEAMRQKAADELVRAIRANWNKLSTGFVGSPYLNQVLTAAGRLDVAYQLLMQKEWPSWLYAVTHGATTIWERWDGWTHDKGFQDPGMNSFNHYAYGAIGAWLYHTVAGIEIDPSRPGYEHLILRPHPQAGGPLTHAKATLDTLRGRVEAAWKLSSDGHSLEYAVTVPPNVTATVYLPAQDPNTVTESSRPLADNTAIKPQPAEGNVAVINVPSGEYHFASTLPAKG